MGVTIRKLLVAMMKTGSKDPKQKSAWKLRPTVSNLPLQQISGYIQDGCKKFVPLLISWARSQIDPFATNGHIDGAFKIVWKCIYTDLPLDNVELDTVIIVVCPSFENTLCSNFFLFRQKTH